MTKRKIIFLVEDDPDISELVQILLEKEGFNVKVFNELKNIEDHVLLVKPHLIIMDLYIGSFDAAVVAKNLKRKKETAHIPVIFVSAKNSLEKIAKDAKVQGFLAKPFNIKDLVDLVLTLV